MKHNLAYLLRPIYMEYLYVEFVCKCIYVYFTYILDGAGTAFCQMVVFQTLALYFKSPHALPLPLLEDAGTDGSA